MKLADPERPNVAVPKRRNRWRTALLAVGIPVAALYFAALAGFDYAMHQPPEAFSRVMMHTGPVPFLLFPFETMWKSARRGSLRPGDTAPDFTLPLLNQAALNQAALNHASSVTLSSFRGTKPVVLIFGSYT